MSANLGTLTLDLIAKISGFVGPLEKATTATKKQTADMRKAFDDWAKGVGASIGVAIAGIPTITAALVTHTALAAKEIQNLSNLAGLSTTEFQKYAAGAATVGIQQEKLADIFKDTNDKVGDFLATGGGELQNFFTQIAPKVGLTADAFRKLNSADALQLYVSSLQKAGVSQAQMTFYMEAIADEATALVPLLQNGAKGFKDLGDEAQATGMILSDQTIASAKEFNNQLTTIGQYANAAKTALAAEFMPILAQLGKDLVSTTKDAGGLQTQVRELANDMIEVTAMIASTGDGIARTFKIIAAGLVSGFSTAMAYITSLGATANLVLSKVTFGELSADFKKNSDKMSSDAIDFSRTSNSVLGEVAEAWNKPWAGDSIREYVKQAREAAKDLKLDVPGVPGNGGIVAPTKAQQEAAKAAEAAAKKISSAYATQETELLRQIALINTTNDKRKEATELAKLQFDIESGKLVGINSAQQTRLEGLAKELDRLKQLKVAEEDRLALAEYAKNLQNENTTAHQGNMDSLAGMGDGAQARERAQKFLDIQKEFNDKSNALWEQLNDKSISQERYDAETALLQEALADRIVSQQDYYNQLDEIQGDWILGVKDAWADYADAATNYNQQAYDATSTILGDAQGGIANLLTSIATGTATAGEAFKQFGITMATSVINALAQMAAQWIVYQGVQLLVGKTGQMSAATQLIANAQATSFQASLAAFASTAAIPIVGPLLAPGAAAAAAAATAPMVAGVASASLAGMAHDGIDSVPQDGTWLLQKGERVTTGQTSAKLDSTLNDIRAGQKERDAKNSPNIKIVEDASKAGKSQRNEDGSFTLWISDFLNEGPTFEAVSGKLGARAVGR
ncbi:tail length tape measure protein [Pseudomonas phage Psp6]|nr:tail length tape measure protein [Pseudomonas phage Psp6]